MMRAPILIAAVLALAACGEKPQTLGTSAKLDAPAYTGPASAFTAAGWTPGDKTSWEQELKVRTQNGQNEYNRIK
jgi:predicted small lipoprotein YifL